MIEIVPKPIEQEDKNAETLYKGRYKRISDRIYYFSSRLEEDIETIGKKGHLDMMSLAKDRLAFLTNCFADVDNRKYLFPIFKYQQKVLEAGHWEAYNMWLLRKGNDDEFSDWINANEEKFNAFAEWYSKNNFDPIKVVK